MALLLLSLVILNLPSFGQSAPVTDESLVLWLKAGDLEKSLKNGDPVQTWAASKGPALTVPDLTLPNKKKPTPPKLQLVAGNPAIVVFDGSENYLNIPGFINKSISARGFTVFMVSRSADAVFGFSGNGLNGGGAVPRFYILRTAGVYDVNENTLSVAATPGAMAVNTYVLDSSGMWSAYLNGSKKAEKKVVPVDQVGGGHFGLPHQAGGVNHAGELGELLIYNRALDDKERAQVENYLRGKYSLDEPPAAAGQPVAAVHWKFASNLAGWRCNGVRDVNFSSGVLSMITESDRQRPTPCATMVSPAGLGVDASSANTLIVKMRTEKTCKVSVQFLVAGKQSFDAENRTVFYPQGGDGMRTWFIDMSRHPNWRGTINQIQLSFIDLNNTPLSIAAISLDSLPPETGLVVNGGFERRAATEPIYGWTITGSGITAQTTTLAKSEGSASLSLSGKGTMLLQSDDIFIEQADALDRYELSYDAFIEKLEGGVLLKASLQCFDFSGKPLLTVENTNAGTTGKTFERSQEFFYLPATTYRMRMTMQIELPAYGRLFLDKISVRKIDYPKESSLASIWKDWQGIWIQPDPNNECIGSLFFRRKFRVDGDIARAMLQITGDDKLVRIMVNGNDIPLGPNSSKTFESDAHNITAFLKKGDNILAIEGVNTMLRGAIMAELCLETKDGKVLSFGTDNFNWKGSMKAENGWEKLEFDDTAWKAAGHYLKYTGFNNFTSRQHIGPKQQVVVTAFDLTGPTAAGSEISYSLRLISKEPALDTLIKLYAGKNVYTLARLKLSDLVPGKETVHTGNFFIPQETAGKSGELCLEAGNVEFSTKTQGLAAREGKCFTSPVQISGNYTSHGGKSSIGLTNGSMPYMNVNGESHGFLVYASGSGASLNETTVGNCRSTGQHHYEFLIDLNWGWTGPESFDTDEIDQQIAKLVELDPKALIVPIIRIDGLYAEWYMKFWEKNYPDELIRDNTGSNNIIFHGNKGGVLRRQPSWASRPWRELTGKALAKFARHVSSASYADRIVGIHFGAGDGIEWKYFGSVGKQFNDYSPAFAAGYREFLKRKYGTLAALNEAHQTKYTDFSEAVLPDRAERERTAYFSIVDPSRRKGLIDYKEYFSEVTAENIIYFGEIIRKESQGKLIVGTYYGYTLEMPKQHWSETGYFRLGKVLRSPAVDYCMQIIRYDNRFIGQECGGMSPESSYLLHGKVDYIESDMRTHLSKMKDGWNIDTAHETIEVLKRDFAYSLIGGMGYKYGYFGTGCETGDPRIMDMYVTCRGIELDAQKRKWKTMDAETSIAVIVDEDANFYTVESSHLLNDFVKYQFDELLHCGAGIDTYLMSDLDKIPQYKCYIFLSPLKITKEQEKIINSLKKNGRTLVWFFAPGIISADGPKEALDTKRVAQITGINMGIDEEKYSRDPKAINDWCRVKVLAETGAFPSEVQTPFTCKRRKHGPLFIPKEGTVLAEIEETGTPAIVVKKFKDWTSVYSFTPKMPAELIRAIARNAGVHVANEALTDTTYLSDMYMAIHTRGGGKRVINMPAAYKSGAVELFTGKVYPAIGGQFSFDAENFTTYMFRFE